MVVLLGVVLFGVVLLTGCGGVKAADLFVVERTGPPPNPHLTLLIDEEGGVECNGRRGANLSDPQIIQARTIQEELHDPATKHLSLPPRPSSVFGYFVRDADGTVRFSDNSAGQPNVLRNLALLTLQVAQSCHLAQ